MGALGEEYGYYGGNSHLGEFGAGKVWPGATSGEEGEALIVGDAAGELWVFHILPGPEGGAVWAAQRMPDDSITIVANMFMIREMDLADPDHFLASAGIEALAKKHGLNRAAFDFTEAFSGDFKAGTRTDQLVGSFYTGRRVWRVFDLAAPSLKLDPELGSVQGFATYPPFVRPEFKLSAGWLRNMLRDHFEGTPYDLTQGPGAGPYGTVRPTRARPSERRLREPRRAAPPRRRERRAPARAPQLTRLPASPSLPTPLSPTAGTARTASTRCASAARGSAASRSTARSSPLSRSRGRRSLRRSRGWSGSATTRRTPPASRRSS